MTMQHDFNKPPHTNGPQDTVKKNRLPIYILIAVGIFLAALVVYMIGDRDPDSSEAPPQHPNAEMEQASMNNTTPAVAGNTEATAVDSTATATDTGGTAAAHDTGTGSAHGQ
jgi:hypothetical protein